MHEMCSTLIACIAAHRCPKSFSPPLLTPAPQSRFPECWKNDRKPDEISLPALYFGINGSPTSQCKLEGLRISRSLNCSLPWAHVSGGCECAAAHIPMISAPLQAYARVR